MSKGLTLKRLDFKEQHKVIDLIKNDKELSETFSGEKNTRSRIANSIYVANIEKNNLTIGFIMIVNNPRTNINEIDMGILKEYRNRGYGSEALRLLKDLIVKNNLEVDIQIRKDNIGAIKSVTNNGFVLSQEDENHNYYTISEEDIRTK